MIVKNLQDMNDAMCDEEPPSADNVWLAELCLDNAMLFALTKKLSNQLKYRQVYMAGELVQIFLYVQG